MYSRSYFQGDSEISVPDNYDGTVFFENTAQQEAKTPKIEPIKVEKKVSPKSDECECECDPEPHDCRENPHECTDRGGIFGFDFKGAFGSLFSGTRLGAFIPKDFGIEEILIIGIALFLLFSPERDIECALLLLALIFIK